MMKNFFKYTMIALFTVGFHSIIHAQTMRGWAHNIADLTTFDGVNATYNNGDIVYVRSFQTEGDGGGGLFVYEDGATVNPVPINLAGNTSPFLQCYANSNADFNGLYDGMVAIPKRLKDNNSNYLDLPGRWIRQWDKGTLNLRWFGANCSTEHDNSPAINTALAYAQFSSSSDSPFTNPGYTAPAKTIFIPTGTYYLKSPIQNITSGVVFEGEGSIADSNQEQGTELVTQINYVDTKEKHIFSTNQHGIFRYIANNTNNSGGGFKNLTITVESTGNGYTPQNVITLFAPQVLPNGATVDATTGLVNRDNEGRIIAGSDNNPAISKWFAENVTISMQGNALRAIYMRSKQQGGLLPYRIQNPNIINCWFSGNTKVGETVTAINTDGLKIIGGGFTILKNETENDPIGYFVPGVSLFVGKDYYDSNLDEMLDSNDVILNDAFGCANIHLDGVDLSNGIIKLGEKSYLINIDCPFGRLEIAVIKEVNNSKWPTTIQDGGHEGLKVTKQHTFNKRNFNNVLDPILSRLKCPSTDGQAGDLGGTSSNVIYTSSIFSYIDDDNYVKCFNCTQEIEMDMLEPTFND